MAAVRVFNYTVSTNSITPSNIAKGGVQGEHNATQINFNMTTELISKLRELLGDGRTFCYRFDGYDGTGMKYSFNPEEFTPSEDLTTFSFLVDNILTRYGGTAQIYLIITLIENDGTEMELYSYAVKLALKSTPESNTVVGEDCNSISTLAMIAKNNAQIAEAARAYSVEAQAKTEAAKAALEEGTEWIFDGGNSETNIEIEQTFDSMMSDTSTNVVQNAVIKQYIDNKVTPLEVDYIVEQGISGIWTYRKWASGIAECWGNTPTKDYSIKNAYGNGYYGDGEFFYYPENLFISKPVASVEFNSNNYGIPLAGMRDLTRAGIGATLFESISSDRNGYFSIQAIGRWKE